MSRSARLMVIFDTALILLFALFLWAPWFSLVVVEKGDAIRPSTLTWLALPWMLEHRGVSLEHATISVTISALVLAIAGALVSIAGRARGSAGVWAAGAWLFGCSVALLMPVWTAVGFLGALLLLVALRAWLVAMRPVPVVPAVLNELWPLGYATGFAVLAWRYNPQVLLKVLIVSLGVGLVGRALAPAGERDALPTLG